LLWQVEHSKHILLQYAQEKSPPGKPCAYPVSLASGKPYLVRLSLFGFGLSEVGCSKYRPQVFDASLHIHKQTVTFLDVQLFTHNGGDGDLMFRIDFDYGHG